MGEVKQGRKDGEDAAEVKGFKGELESDEKAAERCFFLPSMQKQLREGQRVASRRVASRSRSHLDISHRES